MLAARRVLLLSNTLERQNPGVAWQCDYLRDVLTWGLCCPSKH